MKSNWTILYTSGHQEEYKNYYLTLEHGFAKFEKGSEIIIIPSEPIKRIKGNSEEDDMKLTSDYLKSLAFE